MPDTGHTPDVTTTVQQFQGLVTEVSTLALPPGAMVKQENLTLERRGMLESRNGLRPVTFEDD